MELTPRQQLTIEHLKKIDISTPKEIIEYCKRKMVLPRYNGHKLKSLDGKRYKKSTRRTHAKEYFEQIITYYS